MDRLEYRPTQLSVSSTRPANPGGLVQSATGRWENGRGRNTYLRLRLRELRAHALLAFLGYVGYFETAFSSVLAWSIWSYA
jgi:hypothetical protein